MKQTTKRETQIGVRIDAALVARVRTLAKSRHQTLSQLVRMLLEDFVKKAA